MLGRIMANRPTRVLAAAMATLLATSGIAWAATGDDPVRQVTSVVEQVFDGNNDEGQIDGNYEYEDGDTDDTAVEDVDNGATPDNDEGAVDQSDEGDEGDLDDNDEGESDDSGTAGDN